MAAFIKTCVFHEDTFSEYFRPYLPTGAAHQMWGGLGLETYGGDLEIVRRCPADSVWTVVDGEGNTQWIVPGFHFVNRVCYLVTEKPHRFIPVEFRVQTYTRSLTPIGLRRQTHQIEHLLAEYESRAA